MFIDVTEEIFNSLTTSEKSVVEYLNLNSDKLSTMSIVDIAEKSFTSPATVSRTIKKCGFLNFAQLRYKISVIKGNNNNNSITINKILNKPILEVSKTIENISITEVLKIVTLIKKSRRIYILARGLTELVAQEFNLKLQLLGYNTFLVVDPNIMIKICEGIDKEYSVIIFSLNVIFCIFDG